MGFYAAGVFPPPLAGPQHQTPASFSAHPKAFSPPTLFQGKPAVEAGMAPC